MTQDLLEKFATKKANVAILRESATSMTFTILKPTTGRYKEARGAAQVFDGDTNTVRVDEEKLQIELMPECVEGWSRDKVLNEMPPVIFYYLWAKLYSSLFVDPKRIFTRPSWPMNG